MIDGTYHQFVQDGVEEKLSQTFHLNVAPVSTLDTAFSGSRRGSLSGDAHKPRRVSVDHSITPPRFAVSLFLVVVLMIYSSGL